MSSLGRDTMEEGRRGGGCILSHNYCDNALLSLADRGGYSYKFRRTVNKEVHSGTIQAILWRNLLKSKILFQMKVIKL